jgi:hypothetical protein
LSEPITSPLGDLKLTSAAVARYLPVTGRTLTDDLTTDDELASGGIIALLWACRYHDGHPSLDSVADALDAYLEGGGDILAVMGAVSEAIGASAWGLAMQRAGEGVDPTKASATMPSPQG